MMCPVCKKYFCALKVFNDFQTQFYRDIFNHNPSFCYELPDNSVVTCPNCNHEVDGKHEVKEN